MEKSIIINAANADKIAAAIEEAQHLARVRRISAETVAATCDSILAKLFRSGATKKSLDGLRAKVDECAESMPSAYKGIPESTHYIAEYRGGKWRLVDVYRAQTRRYGHRIKLTIPEAAQAAIIAAASDYQ